MASKNDNREQLDTNLFKKIMGDKVDVITSLKEKRDAIIALLDTRYKKLEDLKKEKKEIKKKIRIERRAIIRDENERFSLNRELSRQQKLSTKLTVKYSNEAEEVISSQKYYPENVQKTR